MELQKHNLDQIVQEKPNFSSQVYSFLEVKL